MAIQQTPGIYREDVFPARRAALPTGVPAFLGHVTAGAAGQPVRLTRAAQFAEAFGAPPPGGYLAAAVEGFFANGGRECLVVPLAPRAEASPEEALERGLAALAVRQDLDLVCAPDLFSQAAGAEDSDQALRMQSALLRHCALQGDRFALLDAAPDSGLGEVLAQRNAFDSLGENSANGSNGALYFPWLRPRNAAGFVPPCGHIAGVVARCDQRTGVHKAPANEALEGAVDLALHLTDADQALLNPVGINALRAFPGRGLRVWGARTLSRDAAWTYVSVRRLFLTAARWIDLNLADAAFEPHDTRLWNRITRELTTYFEGLFAAGALKGRSAAEAFFVKCDGTTNPPEVRETGRVVTVIGLAPAIPNEFVVVRVVHGAGAV
jgi:hypothetical protein